MKIPDQIRLLGETLTKTYINSNLEKTCVYYYYSKDKLKLIIGVKHKKTKALYMFNNKGIELPQNWMSMSDEDLQMLLL